MAWTDYSSTVPASWDANAPGSNQNSTGVQIIDELIEYPCTVNHADNANGSSTTILNVLAYSYNIPGFDDGYQPDGVSDPIGGSIGGGGGGGGSQRPSSGFIYPRGDQ